MKVAVVGSRKYPNLPQVRRFVLSLPKDTVLISGGAIGVDREAEIAAHLSGFKVQIFYPDWKKHGKSAGLLRNQDIVDAADRVVFFWDGSSRGTFHTISLAKKSGKPWEVFASRRTPVSTVL